MRFRAFFVWNALGGISWAITYGLVGYFRGHGGGQRDHAKFGIYAAVVLFAVLIVALYVFLKVRERQPNESSRRALTRAALI